MLSFCSWIYIFYLYKASEFHFLETWEAKIPVTTLELFPN